MTNSKKVVFVSGSTHGIGKVIADRFVNDGYTVIQNSRNKLNNNDLLGTEHVEGDVTNYKTCVEIIEFIKKPVPPPKLPKLTITINSFNSSKLFIMFGE